MREGLYALDQIAGALSPEWCEHSLIAEMEKEMIANPGYWQPYYRGEPDRQRVLRHFSYSDRIRYGAMRRRATIRTPPPNNPGG